MTEAAPDTHEPAAHDPWESIGETDLAGGASGDPPITRDLPTDKVAAAMPIRVEAAIVDPVASDPTAFQPFSGESAAEEESEDRDSDSSAAASSAPPVIAASAPAVLSGGGWTIPILCAGLALIACCVLIPQADANRRMAYERRLLEMDLQSIKQQVAMNDTFLRRVADDPVLAERLAQRQMKIIRAGTRVLSLRDAPQSSDMSPFQLVSVAPPTPPPPYKPVGGLLANLCYNPRSRLYLTGAGLLLVAAGLVLGGVRIG